MLLNSPYISTRSAVEGVGDIFALVGSNLCLGRDEIFSGVGGSGHISGG